MALLFETMILFLEKKEQRACIYTIITCKTIEEFSLNAHVRILLSHGGHAGVQQHTVVNGEKALSPSLWSNTQSYPSKVRIIILKMILQVCEDLDG